MKISLNNNIKAAFLMMLGMTLLSSNDVIMKLSSESLGIGQMLFIRGVIAIVVFSLVIKISGKPVISKVILSKWVLLRALCECGATMFFITGLTMMPIAINATLLWTSPIFLTIAAALILKEHVTIVRWLAVFVGFIGMLFIVSPNSSDFSPKMLLPLTAAILVVARDLITRKKLDPNVHSLYVTLATLVLVSLIGSLISFIDWRPVTVTQVIWLSASAVLMSSAFFFHISAVRIGELSFIAPFSYIGILIAIFYGFVVWDELPNTPMIFGITLIIISGLYILSHQNLIPIKKNNSNL
jgi:drug/metabolite transporter (DMT)-like permease